MPGIVNFGIVLRARFEAFMEHWNAWEITAPIQQFERCCDLSVALAIGSDHGKGKYDFFNAHIMTVAQAIRIMWHYFPADTRVSILRQYGFFTILIYILQKRIPWGVDEIEAVDVSDRDCNWATEHGLKHRWALDDHSFKVVRAPKAFVETYGENDGFYLKAATKFINEFDGWEGFGEGVMGYQPKEEKGGKMCGARKAPCLVFDDRNNPFFSQRIILCQKLQYSVHKIQMERPLSFGELCQSELFQLFSENLLRSALMSRNDPLLCCVFRICHSPFLSECPLSTEEILGLVS